MSDGLLVIFIGFNMISRGMTSVFFVRESVFLQAGQFDRLGCCFSPAASQSKRQSLQNACPVVNVRETLICLEVTATYHNLSLSSPWACPSKQYTSGSRVSSANRLALAETESGLPADFEESY